jgi:hypothetical protein
MHGAELFLSEIKDRGYDASLVKGADNSDYVVIKDYEINSGRFAGRIIDLGIFPTPEYPRNVGSAIHVKADPQLYEKSDTLANVRNITDSHLGPEWRYWSNNFNWKTEGSARRLLSQINTIFDNA